MYHHISKLKRGDQVNDRSWGESGCELAGDQTAILQFARVCVVLGRGFMLGNSTTDLAPVFSSSSASAAFLSDLWMFPKSHYVVPSSHDHML